VITNSIPRHSLILVTGSKGFVGSVVVRELLQSGFTNIRCFARTPAGNDKLNETSRAFPDATVQIVTGNLLSPEDCRRAAEDAVLVYHLAAGTGKSFPGCTLDSAVATRNLLNAVVRSPSLKRFVNVSSFSVYSNSTLHRGALLDESCPVERAYTQRFDAYAYGKTKQDDLVVAYGTDHAVPYTILRPGVVFGPGRAGSILGRSGVDTFGFFMHITGRFPVPLTYVDNCAQAIVMAGLADGVNGEVFNVIDDDLPSSAALLRLVKRNLGGFLSIRVPYRLFYSLCWAWEKYAAWSQNQLPPLFNRRMCAAYHQGNRYSNEKLKRLVGWTPKVPMDEALVRYFAYMKSAASGR
jgi:nucleoside-diphosphate-sugar epimerase